ncbi:MAG: hypothetical protein KUG58_11765 [Marinosulfonomonas sp.]|nr:hypothetical protein [Marinosulfonomonas sp.]
MHSSKSVLGLLHVYDTVLRELRATGVLRSNNNPVADFAEHLFCEAFDWSLTSKSTKGHDALAPDGTRYEIKARRLSDENGTRQLSAIRNLNAGHFDFLAGVLFNSDFSVFRAALIPWSTVVERSSHIKSTNSAKFILSDETWKIQGVQDVTDTLNQVLK